MVYLVACSGFLTVIIVGFTWSNMGNSASLPDNW